MLYSDDADRLLEALDDEYVRYQSLQRSPAGADLWYWRQVLRSVPPLRRNERERGGGSLIIDILHLWRRLRRSPVSAGAAILTLSLTLGTGTAVFAFVDAVLLQPPPFADPDAVVTVGEIPIDDPGSRPRSVSYATFDAWRRRAGSLAVLEAFDPINLTLTGRGAAERVAAGNVTTGFLALLGVTPARGRLFDFADRGQSVAIVSNAFWRGRMGADSTVIGSRVVLGGQTHTIVGVLPERFFFALSMTDVWLPLGLASEEAEGEADPVRVVARLAANVSPEDLAGALDDVSMGAAPPSHVRATPIRTAIAGDSERTLVLLAGAAGLAVLIAFTNLAVLLLARAVERRRELAIRRAIGARRFDAARQLVLESVALVGLGIVGGVLLALWTTPVMGRYVLEFGSFPHRELAVSWRAIAGVSVVALVCACACGLLPAYSVLQWRIGDVLRRSATSSAGDQSLRRVLVAAEVAVAFVLLVSMSLLGLSLSNMLDTDPGFEADGVLNLQVALPSASYPTRDRAAEFYSELQDALRDRLGPGAVSVIDELPLSGDAGRGLVGLRRENAEYEAVVRSAAPGYFAVLRIPLVAGRPFTRADAGESPPRAVITESLAERLGGVDRIVGSGIWVARIHQYAEVVGIAGDVKHRSLDEIVLPTVYLSMWQFPSASSVLVVRSSRPSTAVIDIVRAEVGRLDAKLPVYSIRPMQDVVAASPGVPARRLLTMTLAGFAILAALLSAIGLFGIAAHDVAQRRAELAIRVALGADQRTILSATLRKDVITLGSGLVIGGVMAIGVMHGLDHFLYVTPALDVMKIGAAAATMLVAVGAAAVLPVAVSAARSDPVMVLRNE